jgi:hypothetical protein
MLSDESIRVRMGKAAQERARTRYDSNTVNQLLLGEYERLRRQYDVSR